MDTNIIIGLASVLTLAGLIVFVALIVVLARKCVRASNQSHSNTALTFEELNPIHSSMSGNFITEHLPEHPPEASPTFSEPQIIPPTDNNHLDYPVSHFSDEEYPNSEWGSSFERSSDVIYENISVRRPNSRQSNTTYDRIPTRSASLDETIFRRSRMSSDWTDLLSNLHRSRHDRDTIYGNNWERMDSLSNSERASLLALLARGAQHNGYIRTGSLNSVNRGFRRLTGIPGKPVVDNVFVNSHSTGVGSGTMATESWDSGEEAVTSTVLSAAHSRLLFPEDTQGYLRPHVENQSDQVSIVITLHE